MAAADSKKSELNIGVGNFADCRLVTVSGRVDHTNSDVFLADLSQHAEGVAEGGGLVVDLSALEFITSAGLRALLLAQRSVQASGAKLQVAGIGGVVKEVFRISKFDALLSVADSTEEAVAKISPAAAEAYAG